MSETSGSPVTGVIDEQQVVIDFGRHEGRTVAELAQVDPGFYEKLKSERESGAFSIRRYRDKTFRLYLSPLSKLDH